MTEERSLEKAVEEHIPTYAEIRKQLEKTLKSKKHVSSKSAYLAKVFYELMGHEYEAGGNYIKFMNHKLNNPRDKEELIIRIASLLGHHRGKPYAQRLVHKYFSSRDLLALNKEHLGRMLSSPGFEKSAHELLDHYGENHILAARPNKLKINNNDVAYYTISIDGQAKLCISRSS